MTCLLCGESGFAMKCKKCRNDLSQLPGHKSHISQLIRKAREVYDETGEPEELENMLAKLFDFFDELEERQNEVKQNIPGECEDSFKQFQEGTLLLFDGLDELDIYFEDFDKVHINKGLDIIKKAEEMHYKSIADFL